MWVDALNHFLNFWLVSHIALILLLMKTFVTTYIFYELIMYSNHW